MAGVRPLVADRDISTRGVLPHGEGFIVTYSQAINLGLGVVAGAETRIRPFRNGRDLTQQSRDVFVLDLFGLEAEQLRREYPAVFQWLLQRVKPERDHNPRRSRRERWWIFGEPNPKLRANLAGLRRYIATVQTSKHRFFVFLDAEILPDDKLIAIASDDALLLGVLSSQVHVVWALASGARLGVGNDPVYNKSTCFEAFPFPTPPHPQQARIRDLAEQLDSHRKRQQTTHADLTLSGIYNVLEQLKAGEPLTAKQKGIHEQGLVSVLKQLHDELDLAVLEAFGWSDLAPLIQVVNGNAAAGTSDTPATRDECKRALDDALLERLVALNAERAAEEKRGLVRWLRPEFQYPEKKPVPEQVEIEVPEEEEVAVIAAKVQRTPWPRELPEQVRRVADVLTAARTPLTEDAIANRFTGRGPWKRRLPQIVETLVSVGRARRVGAGVIASG